MHFVHDTPGARVVFGVGRRREVVAELAALGQRPLVVVDETAARVACDLYADLERRAVAVIGEVRQHVPLTDAEAARALTRRTMADCVVALGGGSTIGLAKAIALSERLPILAVPTTYSGSEMTPVWGLTRGGVKTTGRDPVVAPRVVVYDPALTYSLPPSVTAASGLNAVAHCVDALWSPARTPLTDVMAEHAIRLLADGLPGAVHDGQDGESRACALAGAWLAGSTFALAGSSLHHKLCHVLGGRFDLPHAETHAVMLPLVTSLAVTHAPEAGTAISRALRASDPVDGLRAISRELNAPTSLRPFGFTADAAEALADEVRLETLGAPFPMERDDVRAILSQAAAFENSSIVT